jgi:hypothetical protein
LHISQESLATRKSQFHNPDFMAAMLVIFVYKLETFRDVQRDNRTRSQENHSILRRVHITRARARVRVTRLYDKSRDKQI